MKTERLNSLTHFSNIETSRRPNRILRITYFLDYLIEIVICLSL